MSQDFDWYQERLRAQIQAQEMDRVLRDHEDRMRSMQRDRDRWGRQYMYVAKTDTWADIKKGIKEFWKGLSSWWKNL